MLTSLVLGAALTAPGAPVPKDTVPTPTGPAPWVVRVQAGPDGKVTFVLYQTVTVKVQETVTANDNGKIVTKTIEREIPQTRATVREMAGTDTTFTTADGTELTADAVTKRAKDGLVLLVSADGKPVQKGWLRAVRPDAVIVTSPGLVSSRAPVVNGVQPANTPAPRLVLLAADADGKVRLAYNPGAVDPDLFGENVVLQANGGVVVMRAQLQARIQVAQPQLAPAQPFPATPGNPAAVPTKSLEDVKFDAYDLDGKAVSREEALKRLKVGGLVLIAGDTRVPDAEYLKAFKGDLLVLVSQELNNVPQNGPGFVRPGIRPLPIQAVPLPAPVAPAVPVKPVGGIKVLPAPAVPGPAPAPANPAPAPIQVKPAVIQRAVPVPAIPEPIELPAKPVKE